MTPLTKSESLFEQYLDEHKYDECEREPDGLARQTKRPDYLLRFDGLELLLEVKEMHEKQPLPEGATVINPYAGLRSEIDEARKKFKKLKDYCCSLVAYNYSDWEARFDPEDVYGAMLGDLGFSFPIDLDEPRPPSSTDIRNIFMGGGKMLRPNKRGPQNTTNKREPQNTTISSVVVLDELRAFDPVVHQRAQQAVREKKARLGRDLTVEEAVMTQHNIFTSVPNSRFDVVRVQVFENPFAKRPLPKDVFSGPFDMRWKYDLATEEIQRVFAGPKSIAMEKAEAEGDA